MQLYIAIIKNNKVLDKVLVEGKTTDECYDKCFEYADMRYGKDTEYELFELSHPRHQVLFENELNQLFKQG